MRGALERAEITREALVAAFRACRILPGDVVLVQSDLAALGPVAGGRRNALETYLGALQDLLGSDGTVVVQAAFSEYGRWETPYDVKRSPVSRTLGVFARYVAAQPHAVRSINPIFALAALGPHADQLCHGGTGSAFGVDSPWDRFLLLKGKMLFIGIDLRFMTFVHYVEYMVGVPHLYSKYYPVPVYDDGRPLATQITAQVRYLDFGIQYKTDGLTAEFEAAGIASSTPVGRGKVWCAFATEAFEFLKERLKQDCFYLLKEPPAFVPGRIPMDGASGPARP